jgi:hypothetical protein
MLVKAEWAIANSPLFQSVVTAGVGKAEVGSHGTLLGIGALVVVVVNLVGV